MSRELKYRVWYKNKYIELINLRGEKSIYFSIYDLGFITQSIDRKEVVLEQFTGLKDKNGKEIYEGDIVKLWDGEPELVVWDNLIGAYEPLSWEIFDTDECEVIGNIHENLELLGREEE